MKLIFVLFAALVSAKFTESEERIQQSKDFEYITDALSSPSADEAVIDLIRTCKGIDESMLSKDKIKEIKQELEKGLAKKYLRPFQHNKMDLLQSSIMEIDPLYDEDALSKKELFKKEPSQEGFDAALNNSKKQFLIIKNNAGNYYPKERTMLSKFFEIDAIDKFLEDFVHQEINNVNLDLPQGVDISNEDHSYEYISYYREKFYEAAAKSSADATSAYSLYQTYMTTYHKTTSSDFEELREYEYLKRRFIFTLIMYNMELQYSENIARSQPLDDFQ